MVWCADADAEEVDVEEDILEEPGTQTAVFNGARSKQETQQDAGDVLDDLSLIHISEPTRPY